MRIMVLILITITGFLTSCYKVYDPKIDSNKKVLDVDGLITNKTARYHVLLTYANSINSTEKSLPAIAANVYVTDNHGNSYVFTEGKKGDYISDSLQFTGSQGSIYRLHIVTQDGIEYESDPQRLFPEAHPDSVYAVFDTKEILERSTGLKIILHGANILTDIRNESNSVSIYRFRSNIVLQYYYSTSHWEYCCWKTVDANSTINLENGEYFLDSSSVRKHNAGFMDDNSFVWAVVYGSRINEEDSTAIAIAYPSYQLFDNHGRILYLDLFTINKETYLYYKSLDEQMQSDLKLFDPIAAQLHGNIKCITDPERTIIGFFETSSVNYSSYGVDFRNLKNAQPALTKRPYVLHPVPDGCRINRLGGRHNNIPSFWLYL